MRVGGLSGVKDVASGCNHSLALKDDGTAWSWGSHYGLGSNDNNPIPVQVSGLSGVTDVAAGLGGASEGYHNLALSSAIPPPTITNPQGNTYDSDGFFSVSGSAQAGSTVELFEGTTSEGSTQADFSSGAWSIDLSEVSEGAHTYSAKAKDAEGNTSSASSSVTVTVEKTPSSGTVSINDGASRTRTRLVTLTLSATDPSPGSGVTDMRISNTESGLSSASWEAYSITRKDWTLTIGTGTKTVYVQYRDGAGNESTAVKDTITYKP